MLIAGPLFLLATLFIAGPHRVDIAILSAIGMVLCFSLRRRALAYVLPLLAFSAFFHHFFLDTHLWQFGIELSVALGFLISALSAEQLRAKEISFEEKLQTQAHTLSNLEEEANRSRQEAQDENVALQNRLSELQKELDEARTEMASLQILNDVIRKSSLKPEEASQLATYERRIAELLVEIQSLSLSPSAEENARLTQELNLARVEREQTYLINETLVRMHASADRKIKELQAHTSEPSPDTAILQERLRALSETQSLYFQLKQQFEEKNEILHQTRKELFHTDTALQAAHLELRHKDFETPLSESLLLQEVTQLEEEKRRLECESAELLEIVTVLLKGSAP